MIELKLTNSQAVMILLDRMKLEFKNRRKTGEIESSYLLEDLNYSALLNIAEASAIDLVFLLPFEIHTEENNLAKIICDAIKSLGKIYNREEFNLYTIEMAKILLSPVYRLKKYTKDKQGYFEN